MKTCIAVLTSPRHLKWTQLTLHSIDYFWPNHPEVKVFGEKDNRDWLTTAIDMSQTLLKEEYTVTHLLLSDHALVDPVKPGYIIGAQSCLEMFDAISYRSLQEPHGNPGEVICSPQHNFCLCPGLWKTEALNRNLLLLDKLLTQPDMRTPFYVDKLFHAGVISKTGSITGMHNTLPMPVHGCLLNGKVFEEYAQYYKDRPVLLQLFKDAVKDWKR